MAHSRALSCRISRASSSVSDQGWIKVGLEVMPIATVTLSEGHGPGERSPSRRYGRLPSLLWMIWNVRIMGDIYSELSSVLWQ
jgi:hypothetical protein